MIVLICPTRNRPDLCKRMVDSARATADNPIEVVLGIASQNGNYPQEYRHILATQLLVEELPTVATSNYLVESLKDRQDLKLFFIVGDDAVFRTQGWDTALIDAYNKLENKIHVFALQDSRDKDGTPHPIVTREYIDKMGYIFTPIFLHWHVDVWTSEMAKNAGCFTMIREHLLDHDKPSDRGFADETHNRIRSNGWKERDAFVNDTCQHFFHAEKRRLAEAMND